MLRPHPAPLALGHSPSPSPPPTTRPVVAALPLPTGLDPWSSMNDVGVGQECYSGVIALHGVKEVETMKDYGTDVEQFNTEHNWENGCRLGRTVGSDYTECDTHHAYVKHGVPPLLRNI